MFWEDSQSELKKAEATVMRFTLRVNWCSVRSNASLCAAAKVVVDVSSPYNQLT